MAKILNHLPGSHSDSGTNGGSRCLIRHRASGRSAPAATYDAITAYLREASTASEPSEAFRVELRRRLVEAVGNGGVPGTGPTASGTAANGGANDANRSDETG